MQTRRMWSIGLLALMLAGDTLAAPARWSSVGPYGGRVDSAVSSPLQAGVVYASAHRSVYRSTDNGVNWSLAAAGLSTITVGETVLAAHPTRAGSLALAGARGVFATLDGGRSWLRRDVGLPNSGSFRTVDISFAPSEPARLYLASEDDGLFRSVNGGASWLPVGTASLPTDLDQLAVDPNNAQVLLVWVRNRNQGNFPASLYRSVDGGANFVGVAGPWDSGGPINKALALLDYNPNTPNTVFLAGEFGNYRSLNGGVSFTALASLPVSNTQRLQSVAHDPVVAGRLMFGTSEGVLLSLNNGNSFAARNSGLSVTAGDPASIGPVIIDAVNSNRWLAFSVSGEVFLSGNAGLNWTTTSTGLRGTAINTVAVHPTRPQRLFAGIRNLRTEATSPALYQSDDNALSWFRFNSALALDTVNTIVFDPGTVTTPISTRIYAGGADFAPSGLAPTSYRGGVFLSIDGGLNWAPADTLVPMPIGGPASTGEVTAMLVDASSVSAGNAQNLFFAARGFVRCIANTPNLDVARIWRSTNAAVSWAPRDGLPLGVCSPRTQYPLPQALVFDGGSSTTLYAGTVISGYCASCGDPVPTQVNGIFKSTNSGQTWLPANNGLPLMSGSGSTLDVMSLVAVQAQPGSLYVALDDPTQENAPGRVFKTIDGGANWSAADDGIAGVSVRALRIDPTLPNRIYAAAAGLEVTPGGVYVSNDGGASWNSISIDLPVDSAQSLALSIPQVGAATLHAGTDEGVWSLTRVPDFDIDGPPDATEDLAPNGGDGNNDGALDRLQRNVASFAIPATLLPAQVRGGDRQGTLSNTELIRASGCQQIYDVAAIEPTSIPADADFEPRAGLIRFEYIDCLAVTARIAFHDESFGADWRFRRYGPASAANVLTLGWLETDAVRAGNVWTLGLVDNSPGDLRREVGRILFVGGPMQLVPLFANGFE